MSSYGFIQGDLVASTTGVTDITLSMTEGVQQMVREVKVFMATANSTSASSYVQVTRGATFDASKALTGQLPLGSLVDGKVDLTLVKTPWITSNDDNAVTVRLGSNENTARAASVIYDYTKV